MAKVKTRLILTCEHGGNRIPALFKTYFRGAQRELRSHRGLDLGALEGARVLRKQLGVPLFFSEVSRLLIDLNRSLSHPFVFSEFTKTLSPSQKKLIIERYYEPYRKQVTGQMKGKVLHASIHSFTPELKGLVRKCDIGVLYDPKRAPEAAVALQLRRELRRQFPQLNVYLNSPYRGYADGFTTTLRKGRPGYVGLELEINQRLIRKSLFYGIAESLRAVSSGL